MEFELDEEQRLLRESVRRVVKQYDLDYWREKDRAGAFPSEIWEALGKNGYLGVAIPEKYEGGGKGVLELAMVTEEACAAGGGSTLSQAFMFTPVFGGETIRKHGNEDQKSFYLPLIAGGKVDFCMALTEPNAGTNTLATATTALRDGDTYVLNGQKVFTTAVDRSFRILVVARTTPLEQAQKKTFGLSLFLVDPKAPGVEFTAIEKVGTHCFDSFTVFFDNVRVPVEERLGEEGHGWQYILDTLNAERVVTAAGCCATADITLQLAADYAKMRDVFDRPIGSNQGIAFPLAKLKMELEAARMMGYRAAWLYDRDQSGGAEANAAKFLAADIAFRACDQAIQTLGGYGYSSDYHVERLWRDVRLFRLAPVSQEMILSYTAHHVLGLPRSF